MKDIDGTDIGGVHFMGTGTYEVQNEDEAAQYAETTPGRSLIKDAYNDGFYGKGSADGAKRGKG